MKALTMIWGILYICFSLLLMMVCSILTFLLLFTMAFLDNIPEGAQLYVILLFIAFFTSPVEAMVALANAVFTILHLVVKK